MSLATFGGKRFDVCMPSVEDRIVHRAMRVCCELVFEKEVFRDFVSGFRPKRNRITALRQAMSHIAVGETTALEIRMQRPPQHIEVGEVIEWLAHSISDGEFLQRVRQGLEGLPWPLCPGSGLTPFLTNVRLTPCDEVLHERHVVRFAETYAVFFKNTDAASRAVDDLRREIASTGLAWRPDQTTIRPDVNPEELFLFVG
jgi:RNA-directed DNA polymerase